MAALVCTGCGQFDFGSPPSLVSFESIWSAILIFFCRTFNLDPFYGPIDLPLLLLEVAGMWSPHYQWADPPLTYILGIGYYISVIIPSTPFRPQKNYVLIYFALAVFLSLEALLRMRSLFLYLSQNHVLFHHQDLTAEDSLKPYQIMFGRSTSITFLKWVSLYRYQKSPYIVVLVEPLCRICQPNIIYHRPKWNLHFLEEKLFYELSSFHLLHAWDCSLLYGKAYIQRISFGFQCLDLLHCIIWSGIGVKVIIMLLYHTNIRTFSCLNFEFEYGFADLSALFFEITSMF